MQIISYVGSAPKSRSSARTKSLLLKFRRKAFKFSEFEHSKKVFSGARAVPAFSFSVPSVNFRSLIRPARLKRICIFLLLCLFVPYFSVKILNYSQAFTGPLEMGETFSSEIENLNSAMSKFAMACSEASFDENGRNTKIPFDNAGYMDIAPEDKGENIRREIDFTLEQMGITPEFSHHEEGPGQNEIDFRASDAETAADNASTFKWIVRTKAASNGLYADFSPKPLSVYPGNGMHINISANKEEKMPAIMAGILAHLSEITYFLNPSEESYSRIGQSKAPKFICWGTQNRSCAIRVPSKHPNGKIQIRSSDSECNIYLAFTLLIYAALDGIKKNLVPEPAVQENLFQSYAEDKKDYEERTKNYRTIPLSLAEARKLAEESEFIKQIIKF